jgi:hypothetical protein
MKKLIRLLFSKKLRSALLFFFFCTTLLAQQESKYWHFGTNAGVKFAGGTGTPSALSGADISSMNTREGCASISDANGNLLFYTDGITVWTSTNTVMTGGTGLAGDASSTQSALIIPKPGSSTKYLIFTTKSQNASNGLNYSIVDMSLFGGLGGINTADRNISLYGGGNVSEKLAAIKQSNGNYWVVAHDDNTNNFVRFNVNSSWTSAFTNVPIGSTPSGLDYLGYLKFSKDGNKLAMAIWGSNKVEVFDFNITTGTITNLVTLTDNIFLKNAYGVEFSPNSRYLYSTASSSISPSSNTYLSQFDLQATNILTSRQTINAYNDSIGRGFAALQLGPDCKIYVARDGKTSLACIQNPNLGGSSCSYSASAVSLAGKVCQLGLPNFTANSVCTENNCEVFKLDAQDSNCCKAGIIRNIQGGNAIQSISYSVIGGVIQGYTTDCSVASPTSANSSGTSSGTISFTPACSNLQAFTTALQSTGYDDMIVTYTVHFSNGDSCSYKTVVKGCPDAPHTACDSVRAELCVCSNTNYVNIFIKNSSVPFSDICAVYVKKYTSGGTLESNFWLSGAIVNYSQSLTTTQANSSITLTPPVQWDYTLNLQMQYSSFTTFSGYLVITVIHCNGDTCIEKWNPQTVPTSDVKFTDFSIKKGVNPYKKLYAYTFKIFGPSQSFSGKSPYKIKYITVSIKDTTGGVEIAGVTGAEQYSEKERYEILDFSLASHARHDALFQLSNPLDLKSKDSSGVFQIFFANRLPKDVTFNCYGINGSVLSSGKLSLDTVGSVGVVKLGKKSEMTDALMIFNGFPTPTTGKYNIKLNLPDNDNISIHVSDLAGKEVLIYQLGLLKDGLSDGIIDLSTLENGNYFITAFSHKQNLRSNTIKVIVLK